MASEIEPPSTAIIADKPVPGSSPLPPEPPPGHQPYVADSSRMPEFTWSAVLAGAVLGIIFGASSLYLVLKVGMTVSASIPVAVLSITLFRWLSNTFKFRRATILENNIVQTTGSAGESIAFGVGVTMPAFILIGFEMEWLRVMVVALLGGLLGILMMIPLRRAFIVKLHGKAGQPGTLLYPEGTACAQVLITGERGGTSGQTVFIGFGLAFAHKLLTEGVNLFCTTVRLPLKLGATATDAFSRVAHISSDMASELLGVGYIIGMRTSSIMMAGAVLGNLVLIPTLAVGNFPASELGQSLRFIGAGCVAAAGIISMTRTLPMIFSSFRSGIGNIRGIGGVGARRRTEDDMPPSTVIGGTLGLLLLLALFLMREVNPLFAILGAALVLLFGFLFVTVSSRLTGEIGSSSNPISGMTVATLLLTCLIFLGLGMTGATEAALALSIGGVVCIAASNGGTTSQDLKTGYLIGATPRLQQLAIIVGALTSALIIGGTLLLFGSVGTVYSKRNLPAVDFKDRMSELPETETYEDEVFHVWRPGAGDEFPSPLGDKLTVKARAGKYLVDKAGHIVYHVDPTITGEVLQRDEYVPIESNVTLTPEQLGHIKSTVTLRTKSGGSASMETLTVYRLWTNNKDAAEAAAKDKDAKDKAEPYVASLEDGQYLVDADGKVKHKVQGTRVTMKFPAPKTQVMGIIINGLLRERLNWALVMIGACIAVALEFCGVSSLAFAVGLYIPMQYSSPIFVGGMVRWLVDYWGRRQARLEAAAAAPDDAAAHAEAEVRAIAKSETSPGMLLASGLIAGGSLGGVVNAFVNFLPDAAQKLIDRGDWVASQFGAAGPEEPSGIQQLLAVVIFGALAVLLWFAGAGKVFAPPENHRPDNDRLDDPDVPAV